MAKLPNMANALKVRKQVMVTKNFSEMKKSSLVRLMSEWTVGKTDSVTKKMKKMLNSCGPACLKIFQYGGRLLPSFLSDDELARAAFFSCSSSW